MILSTLETFCAFQLFNCCIMISLLLLSLLLLYLRHSSCGLNPVWDPGLNAPLIQFLISALFILFACLYRMLPSPLILFSSFFPYLSFTLRIDPLCFQAGCLKRQLNLALVFLCLFCVVVHFFWLVNTCFCCVGLVFFNTRPRDWLGETSPKWPILCRVERQTTTQSISPMAASALCVSGWYSTYYVRSCACIRA